jgi:hypothetical protein
MATMTTTGLARAALVLRDIALSWPAQTRAERLPTLWAGLEHDLLRACADGRLRQAHPGTDRSSAVRRTVLLIADAAERPGPEPATMLGDLIQQLRHVWLDG